MEMNRRRFMKASLAAGTLTAANNSALSQIAGSLPAKSPMLQAKGREIAQGGRTIRLRGMNLGGWMLIEDYMIGLPWTEWKIREQFRKVLGEESYAAFFDAYDRAYVADTDIAFLARSGFNVVRLPFNYRHFESDLEPGKWIESGFQRLHRVVELCRKYNIWVILDLHAAPGAQARDQNAGSAYGETYFWHYRSFIDRTVALWSEIARRYSGDPIIAAYNLLGEPVTSSIPLLNGFSRACIQAIRRVDREHMIMLDPNLWARDIASLHEDLFADPNIIVGIHPYYQGDGLFGQKGGTFDSLTAYPAVVDGNRYDRAALARTIDSKYDTSQLHCPVMASEFGVFRSNPQPFATQLAIVRDQVSIFEERGWSWTMWCYKDLREMGIVTVRPDTPWRRFIESPEIAGFRQRYREMEISFHKSVGTLLAATDIDGDIREQWAREVSRDFDPPALDFILRRLAKHSSAELAEMASSFAFDSCEVHPEQLAILSPYLQHD